MPSIPRNKFDLSHEVKTTGDMGYQIPIMCEEVLPGDSFRFSQETLARLAPLISPTMHNIDIKTWFFFVPNRLIMTEWEDFISGQGNVEWPYVTIQDGDNDVGSLGNYLGYPDPGTLGDGLKASALPFAAYDKIYKDWFISEDLGGTLDNIVAVPGDNPNLRTLMNNAPRRANWERDYFTSALTTPQKGNAILIPLTEQNPIVTVREDQLQAGAFRNAANDTVLSGDASFPYPYLTTGDTDMKIDKTGPVTYDAYYDPQGTLEVDANFYASTIDTLRTAFKVQQYLESLIRGGSRYFEWVRSFFGTTPSDARLQRSEYIGCTKQRMVISEVLSTANTQVDTDVTPVGSLAGHGISAGGGNIHSYRAEEHGWIMGIMAVVPQTAYSQGIARKYTREDYLSYAIPMFANIGEQETLRKELYAACTPAQQEAGVGYQPRYAEYRYNNSRITGEFKTTLNFWHLGRIFETAPTLGQAIECNPSMRIFAVEEGHHIYAQIILNVYVNRNLPRFGVPSLM